MRTYREQKNVDIQALLGLHDKLPQECVAQRCELQRLILFIMDGVKAREFEEKFK